MAMWMCCKMTLSHLFPVRDIVYLADCCGARSGGLSFCRNARCRAMLGARVCAHTTSFTSSQSSCPSRSSSRILLFHPDVLPSQLLRWLPQEGSRAGPGPQRGGLIGDHAPGGTLRGRPPQRLARALPRPGPHAPNLRRATERCWW